LVEHAHALAVGDATRCCVDGMQPDVVTIDAREAGLVAVDGMRAGARFRRAEA
jgi:hypothetical protein